MSKRSAHIREEEAKLLCKYRDNRKKDDEEKEENAQKYENNPEPIRNPFSVHAVEKRREKDGQKPREEHNSEHGREE